jgi:hypothetical protein
MEGQQMKSLISTIITLTLLVVAATANATLITSGSWAGNGNYYEVHTYVGASWDQADAALGSGFHLATITEVDEQAFIEGLLAGYRGEYWLGGFQDPIGTQSAGSNWIWTTGEVWGYTNWAPGEANDYYGPGSEQHLALWSNYDWQWNDEGNLGNITGYIAERVSIPEPASLAVLGLGLIVLGFVRQYKSA